MESLKLDRITFTADLKNEEVLEKGIQFAGGQVEFRAKSAYSKTAYIPLHNDSQAVIQYAGNYPNIKNRFRVDFNPKNETDAFNWLIKQMHEYGGRVKSAINLTRLDFAIDYDLPITAYDVEYKSGVERQYYVGRDGVLETMYFGARSSDYRVRVYDKAKEQGVKNRDWTRVESQMRSDLTLRDMMYAPIDCFPNVKLFCRLGQGNIGAEVIPAEYKAMLYYFERFPWEEKSLGRVKRKKIEYYRSLDKKEIDITGVVKRDMPKLKRDLFIKFGYAEGLDANS